ncbi:MAG: tyrosine-type recombinase/integrase [Rhizobiaceae bacterium]|nr:tyrosine-type recombinase/integrase [Rhizobiaceae bacterium]MCV0404853.1 tyrosine-type recombinase/integrase [Rhizobiaceae bacterium]
MGRLPERLMVRNSIYYCRIWVPRDVATAFGRSTVVASLRTGDLRIAKLRLARRSLELEEQFETLRQLTAEAATATQRAAIRRSFAHIAHQYGIDVCDREFAFRQSFYDRAMADQPALFAGRISPLHEPRDLLRDDDYTLLDHLIAEGSPEPVIGHLLRQRVRQRLTTLASMRATGNLAAFTTEARRLSPGLAPSDELVLARKLMHAEAHALEAILQDQPDALPEEETAAVVPAAVELAPTEPKEVAPSISLDELWDRWERESNPSASTLSTWRGVVRHLKSFLGRKADDVARVEPADIVAWKDKLVASGKSAGTIGNGYLACARALFRYAVANKLLAADPTEGVRVAHKKKAGTKKIGYDRAEVARLLALADAAEEPWKRWLPWLAASTGSRIGEVAQLHASHVTTVEGLPCIHIKPAPDAGSIKNSESERTVPIHSALIKAGFLEFVKEKGNGPLFYGRSSGDPRRKHASKSVTGRLAEWIRASGFNDPRKSPNHALRHWFKSEAVRVGILDSVADVIQGHIEGNSASVYRHFPVSVMAEAIERIQLPPDTAK